MARRGRNEGSINKRREGRWQARITTPEGKRKSLYGKTRQEVAQKLAQAQHDLVKGLPLVGERQTVEQYLSSWLGAMKVQVRSSTYRRYGDLVKHLIDGLGKIPLSRLTAQQAQQFYSEKAKEGLDTYTVHKLHVILHQALKDAVRLGLVQRNITEMIDSPRIQTREMHTLSEDQARHLLDMAYTEPRFEAAMVLAVTTGMREGELLGLRWADVNWEDTSLQVHTSIQQRVEDGHLALILAEPKTVSSRRRIALPHIALEALRAHRLRQAEERSRVGPAWNDLDLVFPSQVGTIMFPQGFLPIFRRLLRQAHLPRIRFHDLRHTAATLLLARGVNPKIVSEWLGHSSVTITLDVYAHVTPNMQQLAADVMDLIFQKGSGDDMASDMESKRPR